MLVRYLPIIIGHKIPLNDEHWAFRMHVLELVDLVFTPAFTPGMIKYLEHHISDHLALYRDLFGTVSRLKPKHHLLAHFPLVIRKSGPMIGMSCMRYELKNSFFKRSANVMCNFTNVTKTLAYRHQCYALYAVLSNKHCRTTFMPGQSQTVLLCDSPFGDAVCAVTGCERTDEVETAVTLDVAGLQYKANSFFVIGMDEDLVFGQAVCFVSVSADQWYVVMRATDTLCYDAHFHSYAIALCNPVKFVAKNVLELRSAYPLYEYEAFAGHKKWYLLTLRWHVL